MCGIIGYVGSKGESVRVLIDGLERLEYRGYDSAGIAFIKDNGIEVIKKEGFASFSNSLFLCHHNICLRTSISK